MLGVPGGGDCSRRGYGRAVFEHCAHACAYCGYGMGDAYEPWLSLCVDHVIPTGAATRLGEPSEWVRDFEPSHGLPGVQRVPERLQVIDRASNKLLGRAPGRSGILAFFLAVSGSSSRRTWRDRCAVVPRRLVRLVRGG